MADVDDANEITCQVCGNHYDRAFQVLIAGEAHTFDSFECAIHLLASTCEHCGCRIIGHGTQVDQRLYCCAHCARGAQGEAYVRDRVDTDDLA
jgi:hypothetical protein